MSQVVQCPSCEKRFRLPPNPPATFTCTGCGTVMDLSDFGGRRRGALPSRRLARALFVAFGRAVALGGTVSLAGPLAP